MFALGVIGLEHDYFYSLTPRVFYNIQVGYNQKEDNYFKNSWLQTRKLMFAALRPHLKNQNSTERDLFRFDWEDETPAVETEEITTAEQAEKVLQEQKEFWKKMDQRRSKANANVEQDGKFSTDKYPL